MKLKERIKTYNFWVSLSSAIFLLLKVLGTQFGFKVDESLFSDLITSLCGILVILGIIVPPTNKSLSQNCYNSEPQKTSDIELKTEISECESVDDDKISVSDNSSEDEQPNNDINFETKEEIVIESEQSKNNMQSSIEENVQTENNEELNTNLNDSFNLQNQFAQILEEHVSLFGDDIDSYIEVLQNQINQLKSK